MSEFAQLLSASLAGESVYAATGASLSIASGRLSYVLGLRGPCVSYDTACSAALTACHGGRCALRLHECTRSLIAGVNLILSPRVGISFAVAGMTSASGRCHTYDACADGYARAEACGAFVLCGHVGATANGSRGIGTHGSAVRQDGRSASLTAPNGLAQQELLHAALSDAAEIPAALGQIEAHGTGTALGDPIEVGSLVTAAVIPGIEARHLLTLGGIKACTGHAEPAAGLTGLLKLALGLSAVEAAPNAQLRVLNPHVRAALNGTCCALPTHLCAPGAEASVGGVSSFGYSGTIAHTVLRRADASLALPASPSSPLRMRRRAFPWRETLEQHRLPPSRACAADTPLAQPRRVRERVGQLVRLSLASDAQVAVLELCDVANFNALSLELMSELSLAISHVGLLVDVRAIVLQAAGPHFCIGAHPHQRPDENVPIAALAERLLTLSRCCCSLRHLAAPVLAAVHGHVVGGGVALCLNASFLICTQTCTFEHGNLPRGEPRTGLSCARALSPGMQLTTCDECACRRVSARRLFADIGHSAWPSSGQRVLSDEHGAQCCSCVECWPGT